MILFALRGPSGPPTHMGLHDVRFFSVPVCFVCVEPTSSIINCKGLFYPYIFWGVGDIFLLYFDGSVWTGLGSPGSLSCTLRIF